MVVGSAPLSAEIQLYVNLCFCCRIVQGYGLTETAGCATLSNGTVFNISHPKR